MILMRVTMGCGSWTGSRDGDQVPSRRKRDLGLPCRGGLTVDVRGSCRWASMMIRADQLDQLVVGRRVKHPRQCCWSHRRRSCPDNRSLTEASPVALPPKNWATVCMNSRCVVSAEDRSGLGEDVFCTTREARAWSGR